MIDLPIVVREGNDVNVFESVSDGESYLEAIDVQQGVFTGYDARGRLLALTAEGDRVTIGPAETEPGHAAELRATLGRLLRALGASERWLSEAALDELVAKAAEFATK